MLWDRQVYIEKFDLGDTVFAYFDYNTFLSYFTSEYTWEFLVKLILDGNIPIHYDVFFQIISTIYIITASIMLYRRGGYFAILLMANPLIFDLAYSQLRSALAISFLYIIYLFRPKNNLVTIAVCLFAATIHTATLIFVGAYLLCMATADEGGRLSRWSRELRLLIVVAAGVLVGLAIGPLRESLLTLVGDRRAEYQDLSSSVFYLSFWVILFGIFLLNYREVFRSIEGRIAILILSVVSVNIFTAGYSLRFLAIAYPFVMSAILMSRPSVRIYTLCLFGVYAIAQWYYYMTSLSA